MGSVMNERKQISMYSLLQILQDSLRKKLEILKAVEAKSKEQSQLLADEDVSLSILDRNMDEKAELIEEISKLDSGFEAMYDSIRQELMANKEAYKEQIKIIQKYISAIMDTSVSIEAIEARNKY